MLSVQDRERFCPKSKPLSALCVLAAGLIGLAGCAVGPDFHRPEASVPQSWIGLYPPSEAPMSSTNSNPVELVQWWKGFNDTVLTSLVERAIASNLDLQQARLRIRQARAARGVVAAGLWPEIDSSASYRRSGSGGSGSFGASGSSGTTSQTQSGSQASTSSSSTSGSSDRDLFQVGLDASWELDIFGGTRRNVEASTADLQAAVEDRRDVLVSLVAEVGTDYASLRGFQQQIAIARDNLKSQKHTAEITRKRFDAGFVSGLDVANSDAQVATTESQIPVLEASARGTIYSLSVLLGLQPAALVEELEARKPIPPTVPDVPVGLPSDLVRRRPDIRRTEAQLHAATARIGVATADLFPKFSLTGSFGFSSSELSSLTNWGSRVWSLGPSVTWPIFDAGRIRANIEVQKAIDEQTLVSYRQAVLTALQEVETALVNYAKEQEHFRTLTQAVAHNRKAVDLSMQLYIAGRTDFLNVLNAQRSLFVAEDALARSSSTLATDLVALYKALGGGWQNEPETAEARGEDGVGPEAASRLWEKPPI